MLLSRLFRVCRSRSCISQGSGQFCRHLSSQETTSALKPFYVAVHPDLFMQHPVQRAANEEAIKTVQEYIGDLRYGKKVHPKQLQFYVRDTATFDQQQTGFRTVHISLVSKNIRDTVYMLLKSCDLPAEQYKPDPKDEKMYIKFQTAFEKSKQTKYVNQEEVDLQQWLQEHVHLSMEKLAVLEPIIANNEVLVRRFCKETGAKDVRWKCSWGAREFHGCLTTLIYLYGQYKDMIGPLKDQILVFTTAQSFGLDSNGHLLLMVDDVPEVWLKLLLNLPVYRQWLHQLDIAQMEKTLSDLLNGVKVIKRSGQVSAAEYYEDLFQLIRSLHSYKTQGHYCPSDLGFCREIEVVIESCLFGTPFLTMEGQFLLPSRAPREMIVEFVRNNKDVAIKQRKQFCKWRQEEEKIIKQCKSELNLNYLHRDNSVTVEQMLKCCQRLLSNSQRVRPVSKGARIVVSQYYAEMENGDLMIPWKWQLNG